MIIDALRTLEKRGAWREVAALYPQITEPSRGAFVKALRRTDAVKHACAQPATHAAVTVLRVMKPKDAPLQAALASDDVTLRREAALAANAVPLHPALIEALLLSLDDDDRTVRAFCISALRRAPSPAVAAAFARRLTVESDVVLQDDLAA